MDERLWFVEIVKEEEASGDKGENDGEVVCDQIVRECHDRQCLQMQASGGHFRATGFLVWMSCEVRGWRERRGNVEQPERGRCRKLRRHCE